MKKTTLLDFSDSNRVWRQWRLGFLTLFAFMCAMVSHGQTGTVGIGSGTGTNGIFPVNSCYGYNYTQQIVKASEYAASGGVAGEITKLRFYYSGGVTSFTNWTTWTVYLGTTTKTSFASNTDWEPVSNLTQVFTGTVTPVAANWFEITFTAPFVYNGTSNLIVAVDENVAGFTCTALFGSYASDANTGIYYRSDGTNPDPATPPSATGRTGTLARLQFVGTLSSCIAPTALTATTTGFTTGTASWAASVTPPANGYDYYYSTSPTAPVASTVPSGNVGTGVLTTSLTGLTANSTYYVWVRSNCSNTDKSSWAGPATFFTGYCTPAPTSVDAQGIINVTMGTINNTTVAENGNYGNYSAQITQVAAGSTVNFSITYATGYTYDTKIWVDWNNDADFTDEGENVYTGVSLAANPTTLTGSFVVPANASLVGSHRIRIGGVDVGPPTPCYSGSYGSYEDYTLEVFLPAAPAINSFTPASYCAATGDITITGTGLGNATLTVGGTPVPVTTNTDTQIVATVPAGVSGVVSVTTVSGTATSTNTFTVTQPTPLVLSNASATICAGQTTPAVTITSGASAFDTFTWSPSTGVSGTAATGYTFNPSQTTTYTLTASQSQGACVIEVEYIVNVNPLPQPVTITASSNDVCLNQVVTLTGNGGLSALPATYCIPTVASTGASGDYINNFSFANITNNNSGDTVADYTYYSALTANVTAGTAYTITVQGGPTFGQGFRAWIDYNQDGVFTASESVYASAASSTAQQTGTITVPATAFNGVTRMRVFARYANVPAAGDFCTSPGYGEYEDYNVNITGATNSVNYVWSPVAGLYTDAAATVAYTGTPASVVYAKVTQDVIYTATATTDLGCSASAETELSVIVTPAPTVETQQTVCQGSTVASILGTTQTLNVYSAATGGTALTATTLLTQGTYFVSQTLNGCESATRTAVAVTVNVTPAPTVSPDVVTICNAGTIADLTANGQNIKWYATATGGTQLAATTAFTQGTTVYYASQTIEGCESTSRAAVAVQVNVTAAPTVTAAQSFCNTATVADLTANGQNIAWYADATGGTALTAGTALMADMVYYASQTVNGCESAARTAVTVTINTPEAPVADNTNQSFCTSGTVAGLTATGENIQWYTDNTGGTALTSGTALMDGMTYYASQTINGCESMMRTAVMVTITTIAAPVADTLEQSFCVAGTVAGLTATGENIQWYADATGGTALTAGTALMNGMTYYASQTVNGCESAERTAVTVTLTTTDAPAADDLLAFCYAATVADLTATGENLQWYTDATGGEALDVATAVSDNLYYVSQTVNGCESTRTPVFVIVDLVAAPQGETTQVIEVTQGQIAMVGDITVNGVSIVWYASEADALAGTNPLSDETAIVSGNTYYAMQTIGECSSTTPLAVTVTTVLGGKDFDVRSFSYYPNPVKDVLTISYSSDITSVAVYNLLGQEVITKSVNAAQGTIDMSNLADGTYMVNVTSGNKVKTIKVVKKQ